MSAARNTQHAVLVNVWNDMADAWSEEETCANDEGGPQTGVFMRAPRDSYTHERPLLTVSLDLNADDLSDFGNVDELSVHLRLTVRP